MRKQYHRQSRQNGRAKPSILLKRWILPIPGSRDCQKNLCEQAGATVQGIGIVIEKGFQGGGRLLREENKIRVESLAIIDSIDDGKITFRD